MLWLELTLRPSGLNSWYPEVCSVLEFLEYPRMFGSVSRIEKVNKPHQAGEFKCFVSNGYQFHLRGLSAERGPWMCLA